MKKIFITLFIILIASQAAFTDYIESNESIFSKYIQPGAYPKPNNYPSYAEPNLDYYDTSDIKSAVTLNFSAINGFTGFTHHWFSKEFNLYLSFNLINFTEFLDLDISSGWIYDPEDTYGDGLYYEYELYSSAYSFSQDYNVSPLDVCMSMSMGSNLNITQNFSFMYGLDFRFILARYIYGNLYTSYNNNPTWIEEELSSVLPCIAPQLGLNYILADTINLFTLLQFNLYDETVEGVLGIGVFY